jgi:hypothetical protein
VTTTQLFFVQILGLAQGVGHPNSLCARHKHLSTRGKRRSRTPTPCCVPNSGRRSDRSRRMELLCWEQFDP